MDKEEIKKLITYMHSIADEVPRGLSELLDALTFAIFDLTAYATYDIRGKGFEKAYAFGKSIPSFDDFDSDAFNHWLIHDQEYLKYWE